MQHNKKSSFWQRMINGSFFYTILAILIGFVVGAIALIIAGFHPIEAYATLFSKIFGTPKSISYSFIEYSTPYILTGLSVAFSFKTGIFNIGAEGQYVMGAIAAMLVGVFVKAPAAIHIPLCFLAAILAGVLWGGVVGYLKVKFGVNEVLSMIMFNWIAYYFSNYVVNLESVNIGGGRTWSMLIQESAMINLPFLSKTLSPKVHVGILIAILMVIITYYVINKTTLGFRLKAVGFNRNAAEYAGISSDRCVMTALAISGTLASLAGAIQTLGINYKVSQFAGQESYGFNGITVALIGATNPIGVLFSGLFFGAMKFGGTRFGAPSEVVDIMMGCIVFFIAISNLLRSVIAKRNVGGGE